MIPVLSVVEGIPHTQYDIRNTQYETIQYELLNTQYAIRNTKQCNTQYDIRNTQYETIQYKIHKTQYDIRNTQYETIQYKIHKTLSALRSTLYFFMQNKPNFKNDQNDISTCNREVYVNFRTFCHRKNKANQSQFKPNFSSKLALFSRNEPNFKPNIVKIGNLNCPNRPKSVFPFYSVFCVLCPVFFLPCLGEYGSSISALFGFQRKKGHYRLLRDIIANIFIFPVVYSDYYVIILQNGGLSFHLSRVSLQQKHSER